MRGETPTNPDPLQDPKHGTSRHIFPSFLNVEKGGYFAGFHQKSVMQGRLPEAAKWNDCDRSESYRDTGKENGNYYLGFRV